MGIPIIFLAFFFYHLAAADCVIESNGKNVTIKENTKVSLTSAGKSLQDLSIQDQDSLGTCYANTASTMLKSTLDNHPDIAYLHASIKTASEGGGSSYFKKDGKFFIDDHNVCVAVLKMQVEGGACPKKYSLPENQDYLDPEVQERLFNGLGKYFDHLNQLKNKPDEKQALLKELASIVSALKTEKEKYKSACLKRKSEPIPLSRAIGSELGNTFIFGSSNDPCDRQVRQAIRKIATPESIIEDYKVDIDIVKDFTKELESRVAADSELSEGIKSYLKDSKKFNEKARTELGNKINSMVNNYLLEKIPNQSLSACTDTTNKTSKLISENLDPGTFLYNLQIAKKEDCDQFISGEDIINSSSHLKRIVMHNEKEGMCSVSSNQDQIMNAILPLLEIGVEIDDKLVAKLSDPNSQYAHQIEQALMPGCLKKENLISLNNIKCEMTLMCSAQIPPELKEMIKFKGTPNTCLDPKQSQKMFRSKVFNSISQGSAPGVNICTGVFVNPSVNSEYCTKLAPGIPKHNFHSVPITGYKCVSGQIHYEIVNSWGLSTFPDLKENKNSAVECQLDKNGNRNGKFWIKESALVNNSSVIFELGKNNP